MPLNTLSLALLREYEQSFDPVILDSKIECITKRKRKPDFENNQNLSKKLIISMGEHKTSG
jgi:hypothetical protein